MGMGAVGRAAPPSRMDWIEALPASSTRHPRCAPQLVSGKRALGYILGVSSWGYFGCNSGTLCGSFILMPSLTLWGISGIIQ